MLIDNKLLKEQTRSETRHALANGRGTDSPGGLTRDSEDLATSSDRRVSVLRLTLPMKNAISLFTGDNYIAPE
jgi:hypothetical protein